MNAIMLIGIIALVIFASACDIDLLEDHDHDADGVQDHDAEDHHHDDEDQDDHDDDHQDEA